jgi:hypothetical protein
MVVASVRVEVFMLSLAPVEDFAPVEAFRLQARLVSIPEGLHILRYMSAKDEVSPPVILIQAMPQDAAHVSLLFSHESGSSSLVSPGDSVVVRALRDVRIVATTASLGSFGAGSAVVKIERIDQRKAPTKNSMAAIAHVDVISGMPLDETVFASPTAGAIRRPIARQKELASRTLADYRVFNQTQLGRGP